MVPAMGSPPAEGPRVVAGRYRLLKQIGHGAMGPTWRAEDELLEVTVAVKQILLPRRSTDRAEQHQRILSEARAAARLVHRNAVTVLDVVEDDGQPWIVMDLVAAESLSTLVQRSGPPPPQRVAEIGLAVLAALEGAHAAGILHHDVKPGNVLLGASRIVLSDFGIATLESDPAFTAPERAAGQPAGPAADLWSLGATLHFALLGRPPGDGEIPADAAGTGALGELLSGLLKRDPQARLDAAGVRRLLERAVAEPARPAAPPPATEPDPPAANAPPPPPPAPQRPPFQPPPGAGPPAPQRIWVPPAAPTAALPATPPATLPGQRTPRRRRLLPTLIVAGVLALAGGLVATAVLVDSRYARRTAAAPTIRGSGAVPAGFTRFTSVSGWSVAVPRGWKRVHVGGGNYEFVEPSGQQRMRVSSATNPEHDALADVKARDRAGQGAGVTRNFLGPVRYRGYDAADWDHTDPATNGRSALRSRELTFTVGVKAYDIHLSGPASQWEAGLRYFDVATATFEPIR
jgi:hypothetical protein